VSRNRGGATGTAEREVDRSVATRVSEHAKIASPAGFDEAALRYCIKQALELDERQGGA
jgi:hypothetical protein